jgi:hypothetical protein
MILRISKKLADKLKIKSLPENENDVPPLDEWYGHLFTAVKTQYIIFTNAFSLYSVIFPGKGLTNTKSLLEAAKFFLDESQKKDGTEKFIIKNIEYIDICKTNNRSILGSINDMIALSKLYLTEDRLTIIEILDILNQTPYSYLENNSPIKMIKSVN